MEQSVRIPLARGGTGEVARAGSGRVWEDLSGPYSAGRRVTVPNLYFRTIILDAVEMNRSEKAKQKGRNSNKPRFEKVLKRTISAIVSD